MRNLIVCLDGTWNTPDQMDRGRQVPSNVVKMARAVKNEELPAGVEQKVYYATGVGTKGTRDKLVGGGTGKGITQNIFDAYDWLIEHYQEGDQLFFFGFSRGAYTARSLAGVIGLCGLPRLHNDGDTYLEMLNRAEEIYRIIKEEDRLQAAGKFIQKYESRAVDIHFIGVWDTVGALGLPTPGPLGKRTRSLSQFHDVTLGKHIRHAYHALAINEQRGPFKPRLWEPKAKLEKQTLVQAWFPGVHSNAGGGYVDCGLSDRTLLWMIQNAKKHGLLIDENYVSCRVTPNWFGELRDSMSRKYKLMFWNKPGLRDIGKTKHGNECLHMSCKGRWDHSSRPEEPPENYKDALTRMRFLDEDDFEKMFNFFDRADLLFDPANLTGKSKPQTSQEDIEAAVGLPLEPQVDQQPPTAAEPEGGDTKRA